MWNTPFQLKSLKETEVSTQILCAIWPVHSEQDF